VLAADPARDATLSSLMAMHVCGLSAGAACVGLVQGISAGCGLGYLTGLLFLHVGNRVWIKAGDLVLWYWHVVRLHSGAIDDLAA
jgi:hypothetical protein